MKTSTETIQCPECKAIQQATIEHTVPWPTKIHHCKCGHIIMESDWNVVTRQAGYYWVKYDSKWMPQYWDGNLWYDNHYCYESGLTDSYYTEINETRILNPDGL